MFVGLLKLKYLKYFWLVVYSYMKEYNSDNRKEGKISVFGIL